MRGYLGALHTIEQITHGYNRLSFDNLNIEEHLINGRFLTQFTSSNTFIRVPMDQTTAETINKDTQTAGGTKGFSRG